MDKRWSDLQYPKVARRQNVPIGRVIKLHIPGPSYGLKGAIVPDAQVMPGVRMDHLGWYGQYIVEKRPDFILCGGDFGDFPSLGIHDRGTIDFEGRRYTRDLAAWHEGMQTFLSPIEAARCSEWNPVMIFLLGNHEGHIDRAAFLDPRLEGVVSLDHLCLKEYGWRVFPFLQPVSIAGTAFCHYFPSGVKGQPIVSAAALMRKLHMSAFAFHQQGRMIHFDRRADGSHMTTIISGSFYQHNYRYLSPFTNAHWRGAWFLHEMKDGRFDELALSINYLKRRYG